ncbi:hypothetical protein D9M71_618120 [compost metagenome]
MAGLARVQLLGVAGQGESQLRPYALTKQRMGFVQVDLQAFDQGGDQGGIVLQGQWTGQVAIGQDVDGHQFDMVIERYGPGAVLAQMVLTAGEADQADLRRLGRARYGSALKSGSVHCLSFRSRCAPSAIAASGRGRRPWLWVHSADCLLR